MSVIGIDLGNMDCVLAQAKRGGIDVLLNENSNRKNPNMVAFNGKHRLMGESAIAVARANFRNTITNIKMLVGRLYKDPLVEKEMAMLPFTFRELPNGFVGVVVNYNDQPTVFSCEQMLAMILTKLDTLSAFQNDGKRSAYCVVSVPGYFTDLQRRGILNALQIANMPCLRLMNEHTAVALSYGIYKSVRNLFSTEKPVNIMFIDMGNTAYTVSIVSFIQGKLEVKAVAYDIQLGGREFDYVIAKHVADVFYQKYKLNPLTDAKARMKLLSACEKTKKDLSPQGVTVAAISVECMMEDHDYSGTIKLGLFEELVQPLLDRLEAPIRQALKDANMQTNDLNDVEIVGGGTRVASVKRKLAEILNLDQTKPNMGLSTTLNADEAAARGCALQCAILSPLFKVKDFDIHDIISYPVCVSWERERTEKEGGENVMEDENPKTIDTLTIMTRTDDFPKSKKINLRRGGDFTIHAEYSREDSPYLCESTPRAIGDFVISGISTRPKLPNNELERVCVYMREDIHGLFAVSSAHVMEEIIEEEKPQTTMETHAQPGEAEKKRTENEKTTMKEDEGKNDDTKAEDNSMADDEQEKPQEESDKMTDASPPAAPATSESATCAPAAGPKKKRFRRVDLPITARVCGLSQTEIAEAIESEQKMANQDREIEETANKRNELESYIYEMRDSIGTKYRQVIETTERQEFEKKLEETENWLYDYGFDQPRNVYQEKLNELLNYGDPLAFRLSEHQNRPQTVQQCQQSIEEHMKKANTQDESTSHWTDEDRETIRTTCEETRNWLYSQIEKQNKCKMTTDPVLTCHMIRSKTETLIQKCQPIFKKPKPTPKPEEKPKDEAQPKAEEQNEKETVNLDEKSKTEKKKCGRY